MVSWPGLGPTPTPVPEGTGITVMGTPAGTRVMGHPRGCFATGRGGGLGS